VNNITAGAQTCTAGPLTADFTFSPSTINVGDIVTFTASAPESQVLAYEWIFNDGHRTYSRSLTRVFSSPDAPGAPARWVKLTILTNTGLLIESPPRYFTVVGQGMQILGEISTLRGQARDIVLGEGNKAFVINGEYTNEIVTLDFNTAHGTQATSFKKMSSTLLDISLQDYLFASTDNSLSVFSVDSQGVLHLAGESVHAPYGGQILVDPLISIAPASTEYVVYEFILNALRVYRVNAAGVPTLIREVPVEDRSSSHSLVKSGGKLFLGAEHGVIVFDISDQLNPIRITSIPTTNAVWDLATYQHYVYQIGFEINEESGRWESILRTIDATGDMSSPTMITIDTNRRTPDRLHVFGDKLWAGGSGEVTLHYLTLDDPGAPVLQWEIDTGHAELGMAARGNVLYACHLWKISTYDVTSIEPYGLGQANFGISHDLILEPHGVRDLTISGNLAYVLTQMDAFSIIDISNQNPDKTLWILKDDGASISVAGNRIVTAVGADGLHIYELGADGWPTFVGRVDTFSHGGFMATGVLTDGIYAYATEDGTEMQVYRIDGPPSNWAFESEYLDNGAMGSLELNGDALYVGGENGLLVFDVRNPSAPLPAPTEIPLAQSVAAIKAQDGLLVAGSEHGQLYIFDASTPRSPVLLSTLTDSLNSGGEISNSGIAIAPGRVYATSGNDILKVDITNPASPRVLQSIEMSDFTQVGRVEVVGDRLLVGGNRHFLDIVSR
jgi:hypothetical protein